MKLRTAKKIMKQSSEDGNGKSTYTGGQLHRALQRYERCKSHKLANAFWHTAMRRAGEGVQSADAGGMVMDSELRLRIGDKHYLVTPNPNEITTGIAWRLTLLDLSGKFATPTETHYDVAVIHKMATCTCGSSHWKKEPRREACKHAWGLYKAGLLPKCVNLEDTP